MKAVWHAACNAILSPPAKGQDEWIMCHCGQYAARWRDPSAGLFEVASRSGEREARVLGFHNGYLAGGRSAKPLTDTDWRTLWAQQRGLTPDSYLFVRRETPLLVIAPGESNDTFWVDWPQGLA